MKRRHVLMTVALGAAVWLSFFGDPAAESEVVEPVARSVPAPSASNAPAVAPRNAPLRAGSDEPTILALQPREQLIKRKEGRPRAANLFGSHDWSPPPPAPVLVAPPPPSAPPLPFKYVGKSKEDGHWRVFLSQGDTTLIVKEKELIDSLYRIETIAPPSMTLIYLPLNETQSLTIE